MRDTVLPNIDASLSQRSLIACLAAILETPVEAIPAAPGVDPFAQIGWWLATRNLALVPVRDPEKFQWAGWWIGRLADGDGYVVMAGTPSGVAWTPPGVAVGTDAVVEGWVIAQSALSLPARDTSVGTLVGIYRYPDSRAPAEELTQAKLIAGIGLEGDRYALGKGHFQGAKRWGQALTLIEAEAIDALANEHGIAIDPSQARRNIVTRGIDLNALVGKRFRVGAALCYGQRLAEPCSWLQTLTTPGILRGLVHRGGLRADILEGGTIRTGDRVMAEPSD